MTPLWLVIVLSTTIALVLMIVVIGIARRQATSRRDGATHNAYGDLPSMSTESNSSCDSGSAAGCDGGGGD